MILKEISNDVTMRLAKKQLTHAVAVNCKDRPTSLQEHPKELPAPAGPAMVRTKERKSKKERFLLLVAMASNLLAMAST